MCMQDFQILRHVKHRTQALTAAGAADVATFPKDRARWGFALSVPSAGTAMLFDTALGSSTTGFLRVANNSSGSKIVTLDMVGTYIQEAFTLNMSAAGDVCITELFLDISDESLRKYLETPQ